jgi:tripartite ATP-independent transporter DctP family solute receptor
VTRFPAFPTPSVPILKAALLALGIGLAAPAPAQSVLKFSHTDQPGGLRQQAAELFGQRLAQYTQNRYKLQIYPAGQLANDPKSVEQLQLGGIDFTVTGTGTYATHIPTLNLTALPYIVESYEQGWKLYDESKWMQAQFEKGPEKGFRFLSTFEAGFRSMTTRDALATPADAKGKKLRTFPNEMMRWTLEAMGFAVQIMPLPEVYLAIQQGTVSGQENPIDTIHANKFYEVAPHVTLTQHVYSPIPLTVSEKTWQKLSTADRDAVRKAAAEAAAFSRKEVAAAEARQLADMQSKGAKIGRPALGPFRDAVQPAYAKAREKYGTDVDTLLADADGVRKALPAK